MEKITSLQNTLIKKAVGLREAKNRKIEGLTIIDGIREILRAFESGIVLDKVFYLEGQHVLLLRQISAQGVELVEVSGTVMEKLAYGDRHEGIIAIAHTPHMHLKDLKLSNDPLLVIVEGLEKPGNLGAILRTCDSVGVDAVLVCDAKTDIYNPNVIRASTGTIFRIPVVCSTSEHIRTFLKEHKIKVCAAAPAAKKFYTDVTLTGALALVLGAEDAGLSDFWFKAADVTVKIPMKGIADSLNVSTSAAVILYEALRQRAE